MQQSHRCVSRDGGILLANGHDCNRNGLNGGIFLLPTLVFQTCFPQVAIAAAVRKVHMLIIHDREPVVP